MSTAQVWMAGTLLVLIMGRLVTALAAKQNIGEALLNFGIPMAVSAAAGGLAVLTRQAQTLQNASKVSGGEVVSGTSRLGIHALSKFGSTLLINDVLVYAVFVIVLCVILFEIHVAGPTRATAPADLKSRAKYIGVGLVIPAAVGAAALYIIYTRS